MDEMRPASRESEHGGWIDVAICEGMLLKPLNFVCAVDGSDVSMAGLHYLTEGVMQQNRETNVEVLHVYDDSKKSLPPAWRPDALRATVEAKLTGSVSQKRYRVEWTPKDGKTPGQHLCERVQVRQADFSVMGFVGRKGKTASTQLMHSNVQACIQNCQGACIVLKDDSPNLLPIRRVTKFVVSVSLNQASTKAFLDALRLSQPGDEIHVVYVKCFMERTDSDYTIKLREKYSAFFAGLKRQEGAEKGGEFHFLLKFQDRKTEFVMVTKQRRESTAQAVVRYGESIGADFMCVGTNTLRVERGKRPLGSVSLDICMEWDRNFIVSHWIDINPKLYEKYGGMSRSFN